MMVRAFAVVALLLVGLAACDDETPTQPIPERTWLLPPTSPENVIRNIEFIYDDTLHTAAERSAAFEDLLSPFFLFHFQPIDQQACGCENWGREEEVQTHSRLFHAQESGEIYSLRLDIKISPAEDVPNMPGLKRVFADIFLEVLQGPNEGYVVRSRAEFLMELRGERWLIREWYDLPPRPGTAEGHATLGRIKASYYHRAWR